MNALEKLTEEIAAIKTDLKDLKKKLDDIFSALDRLSEQPPYPISSREVEDTYTLGKMRIPVDEIAKLLACLSNPERIKILQELSKNAKYFTDLLKPTKITHSPLRFHLRLLLNAGYIMQERKRGKYLITTKGEQALHAIDRITGVIEQPKNSRTTPSYVAPPQRTNETQPEWLKSIMKIEDHRPKIYS